MPSDPGSSDVPREVAKAFEVAKAQMERLRGQFEEAIRLAQAKTTRDDLADGKEKALRDLGAQVYQLVRQGKLSLPASAGGAVRAVEAAERQLEAQAREINDLLKEGDEVARPGPKPPARSSNSTVANKPKKR